MDTQTSRPTNGKSVVIKRLAHITLTNVLDDNSIKLEWLLLLSPLLAVEKSLFQVWEGRNFSLHDLWIDMMIFIGSACGNHFMIFCERKQKRWCETKSLLVTRTYVFLSLRPYQLIVLQRGYSCKNKSANLFPLTLYRCLRTAWPIAAFSMATRIQ